MKVFTLLLVLTTTFIINVGLYYVSEDYKSFLKGFKSVKQEKVTDEYFIDPNEIKESLEEDLEKEVDLIGNNSADDGIAQIKAKTPEEKSLKMSPYEKEMLFLFRNYNFTKLSSHGSLFDITTEYPDEYFEYYLPDLTLIFFSTKQYREVKEIFEVEQDSGNFSINEVDNFGEESFYINLGDEFDDGYIRIVFTKEGKVFGLKISENEYNNVKSILKSI